MEIEDPDVVYQKVMVQQNILEDKLVGQFGSKLEHLLEDNKKIWEENLLIKDL